MSKSFKLVAGDLSVGVGRNYSIVTGQEKLLQDLTLWILERIGIDPATPTYGSRLDGGVIGGQVVPSFIGGIMSAEAIRQIRQEITNVIARYQQNQLSALRADVVRYNGGSTLDASELIASVDSVETQQMGTALVVRVMLTTVANQNIKLTIPISENGIG